MEELENLQDRLNVKINKKELENLYYNFKDDFEAYKELGYLKKNTNEQEYFEFYLMGYSIKKEWIRNDEFFSFCKQWKADWEGTRK